MWQFFVECVSSGIISYKYLSHLNGEVFLAKRQKISKLEKLENMMKKQGNLKKKRFHLSKRYLYPNGKAQNMLVVAGRLVYISTWDIVKRIKTV